VGLIPLPPEETEKSLLGLLCTGAVAFAADRPPAPPAAPAPAPPAAGPSTAATPPKEAASRTPGPEEVRRLILETYESHRQRDHFEVLGVRPEAEAAEVRAAYARLARILHPDACRDPILADVNEQREAVFVRVREAYEALRDPKARSEYEAELRRRKPRAAPPVSAPSGSGPDAPPPDAPPEEVVAAGEEFLRSGQYGEAIQQLEPVLDRTEGALRIRARLALARASMKYPEWLRRAEAHLQEVLREDPAQLQDPVRLAVYLLLGDIYKASALPVRAAAMYRKALTVQPGNRHAQRELAGLEGATPAPAATSSLLGFLKKR
jgi:hypothetical protein